MVKHFDLMIPGADPDSEVLTVNAPYDRAPIATVARAGSAAVETALQTASDLYAERDAWLPVSRRLEILDNARLIMQERRNDLAHEAALEGGKPLMDSMVEVDRAIDGMKLCVSALKNQAGHEVPMNLNAASKDRLAFTQHEPIGVVLAFSAFNHPLNLIVHQVGPAVAAGCPVIVKPAEATPLSCMRFVAILHEAGLAPSWCQALMTTDRKLSGKLVADPRVAFFSFIGSAKVGWMLRSSLAPGTRCALEHGGAAPALVAKDADLAQAIPLLLKGGFYHAGQVCVSVQRIFADKDIAVDLAGELAERAGKLMVGDPTNGQVEVGPLIRESEVDRVHAWVTEAVAGGGRLLCGGKKTISASCYAPTVLLDPPADAKVSTEEIFGPVVCVYSCEDMEEAILRANSLPFAFQASCFTTDLDFALRAARRLDAAAVMINEHTAFRVDWMPFAGLKQSGLGIGGIPYSFADMQVEKLVVIRSPELAH